MGTLSNLFGYILNFIYNLVLNYGVAIILFSLLFKLILLPLSIKQQKSLIKQSKLQGKFKEIQDKYKRNSKNEMSLEEQKKMSTEINDLYKQEGISPFSGCITTIIQLFLLIAIFGLVRNPLTYMKKVDSEIINNYKIEMEETTDEKISTSYPEISILNFVNKYKGSEDPLFINMEFLGFDLSKIPKENYSDYKVYIIPAIYVVTSIISMKIASVGAKKKKEEKKIIEITDNDDKKENQEEQIDMSEQMSKNMSLFMPIMAVSVALIAPLGLALYWVVNNILMIIERIVITKVLEENKEA